MTELKNVKKLVQPKVSAPGIMTYVRMSSTPKDQKYTLTEVARLVGKSPETLVRWEKKYGLQINSETRQFGETTVRIFTDHDVTKLRSFAAGLRTGRPKKSA